jgi:hypothetical protein
MDAFITMVSGRQHLVTGLDEDEVKELLQGWADPGNFLVGIPGEEENQIKYLVRLQIEMVEVTIVQ